MVPSPRTYVRARERRVRWRGRGPESRPQLFNRVGGVGYPHRRLFSARARACAREDPGASLDALPGREALVARRVRGGCPGTRSVRPELVVRISSSLSAASTDLSPHLNAGRARSSGHRRTWVRERPRYKATWSIGLGRGGLRRVWLSRAGRSSRSAASPKLAPFTPVDSSSAVSTMRRASALVLA
jgi:hypothetical protein